MKAFCSFWGWACFVLARMFPLRLLIQSQLTQLHVCYNSTCNVGICSHQTCLIFLSVHRYPGLTGIPVWECGIQELSFLHSLKTPSMDIIWCMTVWKTSPPNAGNLRAVILECHFQFHTWLFVYCLLIQLWWLIFLEERKHTLSGCRHQEWSISIDFSYLNWGNWYIYFLGPLPLASSPYHIVMETFFTGRVWLTKVVCTNFLVGGT